MVNVAQADAPNSGVDYVDDDGGLNINIRAIWAVIYRNRLLLASAVFVCILLGIIFIMLATPIYEATASVQVEENSVRVLKSEDMNVPTSSTDAERFLQTQVDVMKSRSLALAVARDLRLVNNKEFLAAMGADEEVKPIGTLSQRDSEIETVVKLLDENLTVVLPVSSRVVSVSFRSSDPALAAKIANSYVENFIRMNLQRKYDTSAYARDFLSKQLDEARQQLERSEQALVRYARSARLIDASNAATGDSGGNAQSPRSLTIARLVRLNAEYSQAVAKRIAAEQRWREVSSAPIMNVSEVLSNQAIQELVQRRAELRAAYQEQRQARKEDYPTVRQARAQLDELERQINTLANNIRASIKAEYDVAAQEEAQLRGQIGALESETLSEQGRNVQMTILQRASDTNRTLYDTLLQRYRELSAESGIQPNNIQIVDRADVPGRPISPRVGLTLLLSTFGGLVIGLGLVFARHQLDDTIRSAEDLGFKLGLPFLGAVPVPEGGVDVTQALADPKSPISEAFNSIRASMLLSSGKGAPPSMLLTSAQPSEGKSTCAFALSERLGRIGKRVVIMDCDMRRPSQHRLFGIDNDRGVSDLIAGQATVEEVAVPTRFANVTVIPCGAIPPNPTELLTGQSFEQVVSDLTQRFDIVLIDGPPILGLADAVLIGAKVQATVLVVESGRNHHGGSKSAVGRLQKAGSNIIGVILTKHDARASGYGVNYGYSYTYGADADR